MVKELAGLSKDELELVVKAPLLVGILIAGADGNIDQREMQQGLELSEHYLQKATGEYSAFFRSIAEDFDEKFNILLRQYPRDLEKRQQQVVKELEGLNPILRKIDPQFSRPYHQCLMSVSRKIAESSGGFLKKNKVGPEESAWVSLPMITEPGLHV
ncbi:MAG: hypothetical protein ACK5DD_14170 [Cyclobacteriaceae bacterium]|jgi:hypothetical protein